MTDPLTMHAVAVLARGHRLFAGAVTAARVDNTQQPGELRIDGLPAAAARRSSNTLNDLGRSTATDRTLARIMATAHEDHARARSATRAILDDARADASAADTPMARREAMARMAGRLRTQRRHILDSRRRARLLALRLRRLRYRQRRKMRGDQVSGRPAVVAAIRKAVDIKNIHDPAARARWERGMDLVARRESNYNANAVNDWDSNAARGTPSKGAWQFIAPTFAAYHQPGTSRDIHNLVAQACAFINYAMGRYGVAPDASNLADLIQQADPRRSPKGY